MQRRPFQADDSPESLFRIIESTPDHLHDTLAFRGVITLSNLGICNAKITLARRRQGASN